MTSKPSRSIKTDSDPAAPLPTTAYYPIQAGGILRIAGPDRKDFLQRQTTNDLVQLSPGRPLMTVLTSPTARILDVLTLIEPTNVETNDSELLAITLPDRAETTAAYLRGKIFFMDKVTVVDVSADFLLIELFGAATETLLESLGFGVSEEIPAACTITFEGQTLTFIRQVEGPVVLMVHVSTAGALSDQLESLGAAAFTADQYQIQRVETGRPGSTDELTADYTPLENNLTWAISSTKGCYTGQEVIARQITYDKVTRKLIGIRLAAMVTVGSKVWSGKQAAGTVTSTALSPQFGPIALAMLKRPHHDIGTEVTVGEPGTGTQGVVSGLPFISAD